MRGVQAVLFDGPRSPAIPADTEARCGSGNDDVGTVRMGTNLMDVGVDLDGGTPRCTPVSGSWNATDMHIGEQRSVVARCGYRANPQRRSDQPPIDERRSRIPLIPPSDTIKPRELLENGICTQPQDACIVRPDVDCIANRYTA